MTDQEKIELAAERASDADTAYGVHGGFLEGVAWRDRNPSPHVMALYKELSVCFTACLQCEFDKQFRRELIDNHIKPALDAFEKQVKGE